MDRCAATGSGPEHHYRREATVADRTGSRPYPAPSWVGARRAPVARSRPAHVAPSATARARPSRSRVVVRIPAGTCPTRSVNVCCGPSCVRHRQRRLRHCIATAIPPQGDPLGGSNTHSLADVETSRQPGHRAASGSSVTQRNDFDPTRGKSDTFHRQPTQSQQTRRIIATVDHGPWLSSRCSRTQRGSRSHGPPSFRRAEPGCPIKIGEPG